MVGVHMCYCVAPVLCGSQWRDCLSRWYPEMSLYCFLGVLLCKEFCVGLDGELVLQEGSGVGYQGYDPWSRLS